MGAKGYLLKQITGEDLVRHLERVAEGETVIDAALAGRAVASAARMRGGESRARRRPRIAARPPS